jgi:hypothetical protein
VKLTPKLILSAALAFSPALTYAAGLTYKEAAAPWSSQAAGRLAPQITADFLKDVRIGQGPAAAEALSEKKAKVSDLLKRFGACTLNAEDVKAADKYLDPEFRSAVKYFAGTGCAAVREAAAGHAAVPRSASLSGLEGISASGAFATYGGSARFFDGASSAGPCPVRPAVNAGAAGGHAVYVQAAQAKPLSSAVPAPPVPAAAAVHARPERPADIGQDGMVHQAMAFWNSMRKENWQAFKNADTAGARAKALLKAGIGAGFGGLLAYSNLANVETEAAKLGWDAGAHAGAGKITADSARLLFHCGVTFLTLAPIPMLSVAKGVIHGEAWAIALAAAMSAGTVNRIFHFAD